ncbi:MAG TPA: ABATE domain-containing protein [Terriglobales bacterium]|nr:ABATE domain-containing protein [Terriglobales bacterium]
MAQPEGFTFELTGGALCLDFVNTLNHRGEPGREEELLPSYRRLLAWSRQARALPRPEVARLARLARVHAGRASSALRLATRLREALYRIFSAVAAGRAPAEADLRLLNAMAAEALSRQWIVHRERGFVWEWRQAGSDLRRPLWPVVRSAVELLTSDERHRVRECASATCSWLFLDHSRNHSRRWCDMKVCGNRAKARRFYRRARSTYRSRKRAARTA